MKNQFTNITETQNFANVRSEVYLYGSHMNRVNKGWKVQRHVHHMMFEINLVIDGCQTAKIGKNEYHQQRGDLILISPMQTHEFSVTRSDTMQYFVMHVQINDPSFLKLIENTNISFYPEGHDLTKQLTPLIYEMYKYFTEGSSNLLMFLKLYELMNLLKNNLDEIQEKKGSNQSVSLAYEIARAIEKIILTSGTTNEESLGNWLETISSKLAISRRHCHRVFQQIYGASPRDYLNILRQQEAMQKLVNTNDSIEQIANTIGYENIQSFSRQFLKWTGMTPSTFRKSQRDSLLYLTPIEIDSIT
jgi:AraC-like DNA-binding protein/mannose-6-phosphate isomerase-like protein (cupin superfamily)